MLKVGVQSGGLFTMANCEEGLRTMAEHGFKCCDFNIDVLLPGDQIRKGEPAGFFDQSIEEICEFFKPLRDNAQKYDIDITQMHGPFPMWVQDRDEMNEYTIMATEKCFAVMQYVGCKNIVVHPTNAQYVLGSKEAEREINLSIYRRLMPAAKKYGITICLENLFASNKGRIIEGPCSDVAEIVWYLDKLNAEAGENVFGFCLDVGHANLCGRNLYEYIKGIGHRLTCLHIHDNDGLSDLHMLPYSYTRNGGRDLNIDWPGFIKGLHDIGYKGDLCFETFRCMLSAYPASVHPQLLDLIRAIGEHFVAGIVAE